MYKIKKATFLIGVSSLFLCSTFSVNVFGATDVNSLNIKRLSGQNRYQTSMEISKQGWTNSDVVVLASGNSFADALCAAPLAKLNNAPILLTSGVDLEDIVQAEIIRLGAKKVYIIGGTGVITESEENKIKALCSEERIFGQNRYETSVKLAEKLGKVSEVSVVTGADFADALSIASIAAEKGMPILLTQKDAIPESLQIYLNSQTISKSYIIGGTGVIGTSVEGLLPSPERLNGVNRFETNLKILEKFNDELDYSKAFVAVGQGPTGTEFADALSGAAIAAKYSAPLVLTATTLPTASESLLKEQVLSNSNVFLLGGQSVVPETIKEQLILNVDNHVTDNESIGSITSTNLQTINSNLSIAGKNITLQNATIEGNLFIYSSTKLKNVTVHGNLIINVDPSSQLTLDTVTANIIKVKSGDAKNISCTAVTAKILQIATMKDSKFLVVNGDKDNAYKISIGTDTSGGGGGTGTVISDTTEKLKTVLKALPSITASLSTDEQKAIVNQVQNTITSMLSQPNYNYQKDAATTQILLNSLPADQKSQLMSAIVNNISFTTLANLKSIFGL